MNTPYDLIIIGAGPGGLTAGLYAMRAELNTVLLEQSFPGGQVTNTDLIENYPGFPGGVVGRDLAQKMLDQVQSLNLPLIFAGAKAITREDNLWRVETGQDTLYGRCVIISTGASPRYLNIPGEKKLTGKGVSYCATCDGAFFKDEDLAVIGGGDSAIDEALYLSKIARSIRVIHRRDALRAEKYFQTKAFANPKIDFAWDSVPVAIEGEEKVEGVRIKNIKSGQESTLAVTGVFIYIGLNPNTAFLGDLVKLDEGGFIPTDENCCTELPGLFAVGDVRVKEMRQIATAVGDGDNVSKQVVDYLERIS